MISALLFDSTMANRSDQRKMWIGVGGFGAVVIAIEILLGRSSAVAWVFSSVSLVAVIVAIIKISSLARSSSFFQD